MKRTLLYACLLVIAPLFLQAQNSDYKVVFDLTSKDTLDQKAAIRLLNEISGGNREAKLEVVMYGKGFNLVLKNNPSSSDDVLRLAANKNISFKVCEISMKNNNVTKTQLLSCVEVVPDGIYEIITKQKEGWGYIKVVH